MCVCVCACVRACVDDTPSPRKNDTSTQKNNETIKYFPIFHFYMCAWRLSVHNIVILINLAAHFTFSGDYRKFRTLQWNWFLKQARRHHHVQPFLQALHWSPVRARIDYKLLTICHNFWLISCLPLWHHCVHHFQTALLFCSHTDKRENTFKHLYCYRGSSVCISF